MSLFGWSGFVAVLLVVVLLVVVVVTAGVLVGRARRLDRLHVRVDAARSGLLAVLDRRAAVVRTVAAAPSPVVPAATRRALRAAARAAEDAGEEEREAAENDLARHLAALDSAALAPDLAAELADADARVVVARRVHNDAVRDTRALRGRRMVRMLRLAGNAPFPRYFEIAEAGALGPAGPGSRPEPVSGRADLSPAGPDGTATARVPRSGGPSRNGSGPSGSGAPGRAPDTVGPPTAPTPLQRPTARARDAVRVVALDDRDRALLLRGVAPDRPGSAFWFLPGGGVEPGQDPRAAAARWFAAATGRRVDPGRLTGPVWVRDVVFTADGVTYGARESFLVLRGAGGDVDTGGFPAVGARTVRGHRWWTSAELSATVDTVHPRQLADLLADPGSVDPADPPVAVR